MTKLACAALSLSVTSVASLLAGCADVCTGDREPSFFVQPELSNLRGGTATRVSLGELCETMHGCPTRAEAMKKQPIRVAGCGVESFQWRQGDLAGTQWNFSTATGKLIGVASFNDVTSEVDGCQDSSFQAGAGPPLQASDAGVSDHAPHRESCEEVTVER